MRTAKEIWEKVLIEDDNLGYTEAAIRAINQARREVIKEVIKYVAEWDKQDWLEAYSHTGKEHREYWRKKIKELK